MSTRVGGGRYGPGAATAASEASPFFLQAFLPPPRFSLVPRATLHAVSFFLPKFPLILHLCVSLFLYPLPLSFSPFPPSSRLYKFFFLSLFLSCSPSHSSPYFFLSRLSRVVRLRSLSLSPPLSRCPFLSLAFTLSFPPPSLSHSLNPSSPIRRLSPPPHSTHATRSSRHRHLPSMQPASVPRSSSTPPRLSVAIHPRGAALTPLATAQTPPNRATPRLD